MARASYAFSTPSGTFIPQYTSLGGRRRRPRSRSVALSVCRLSMAIPTPAADVRTVVYGEGLMDLHELPGGKWDAFPGGAPNNLACALGKLGHPTAFVGSIGDDEYGRRLISELKRSGVNIDTVQMFPDNPTRGVYVKFTEDGQPEFAGYSSKGSVCADAQEMDTVNSNTPISVFPNAVVLAIGTLPLASPGSRRTQELLVRKATERGMRVVVDLNWRNVFWSDSPAGLDNARRTIMDFVRNAAYIKASVEDLKFLLEGFSGTESASEILAAFGANVEGMLITDGEEGCKYIFRNPRRDTDMLEGTVGAFKAEDGAVDTVGAGDAFLAGFIAETFSRGGLDSLRDPQQARDICRFAAAVAHFVVREKGAVGPQPTRGTVENFLHGRSPSPSGRPTETKDASAR